MDELLKMLLSDLESAVSRLMEIAPQVWAVYILQVRVWAIQQLAWALFLGLAQIPTIRLLKYSWHRRKGASDYDERAGWNIAIGSLTALSILLFLLAMSLVSGAIGKLINPNYYAIVNIFNLVKGD